jgi:hypothetical protein
VNKGDNEDCNALVGPSAVRLNDAFFPDTVVVEDDIYTISGVPNLGVLIMVFMLEIIFVVSNCMLYINGTILYLRIY